jgi:XTP/dITP diphosphohydrolase
MTKRDSAPTQAALLVLATANPGKLAELTRILAAGQVPVRLAGLGDFPGAPEVRETGATFAENALLKAHAIAEFTHLPSVADDSGICVDALNGMPGVLSARWSGKHGDDEGNLRLLLAQMADVPQDRRGAYFACAAALVVPSGVSAPGVSAPSRSAAGRSAAGQSAAGREHVSEGTVHGRLTCEPRGENGFGYDPIFVPDVAELTRAQLNTADLTTAQLSPEAKDAISHRGKALRALAPVIAALLG